VHGPRRRRAQRWPSQRRRRARRHAQSDPPQAPSPPCPPARTHIARDTSREQRALDAILALALGHAILIVVEIVIIVDSYGSSISYEGLTASSKLRSKSPWLGPSATATTTTTAVVCCVRAAAHAEPAETPEAPASENRTTSHQHYYSRGHRRRRHRLLLVLDEADQAESGRWRRRFGRGVKGPKPVWRGSSSGNAKSRILTDDEEDALRACCCCCCCCWASALSGSALSGWDACGGVCAAGSCGFGVEFGRERVEEHRESAAEVRREATGEGGAGREEVSELREDLRPSRVRDLAGSVGVVAEEEGGEEGWMMVVSVFWLLARGVVGGLGEG
jgi:hypothetical protein